MQRLHAPRMPLLRKREGLWECIGWQRTGYGYTWQQAHAEWKTRTEQNLPTGPRPLAFNLGAPLENHHV
jgi:hypothetical protein